MHWAGHAFIVVGLFFLVVSGLGVLRMPDVFNRLQAGTKASTLGFLGILAGTAFFHPAWILRLLVFAVFLLFTAPLAAHALARAAHRHASGEEEGGVQ